MEDIQGTIESSPSLCPTCHLAVLSSYYFCPNCGANLNVKPLPTGAMAQAELYIFSAILPLMGFLFVTRWHANKYVKSDDPKAKQIGILAWSILIISTIITIYFVYVWTMSYINSTISGINSDFGTGTGF